MPGFAAGPCLFKDTMQLAAFNKNNFVLGHSAMLINEGLPLYLVSRLEARFDLADADGRHPGHGVQGRQRRHRVRAWRTSCARSCCCKAGEVLCTDPYVARRRGCVPLDEVLERADLLVIAAPHAGVRATCDTDQPVVDMWGLTGRGRAGVSAAGSRWSSRSTTRARRSSRCLDRILREVLAAVRGAGRARHAGGHHRPVRRRRSPSATRGCGRCSTPTGAGRPTRSGSASTRRQAPVVVVTMADGCDDPRQIDELARLVDRGVVVAAASRYMPGGQQVGGPRLKRHAVAAGPGARLQLFARVGTRDATNSFKAYDTEFVREVGIESPHRVRDRPGADRQGDPAAPPVAEIPTIWLDRQLGESHFDLGRFLPSYLRWYRFAFGRRLDAASSSPPRAAASPTRPAADRQPTMR